MPPLYVDTDEALAGPFYAFGVLLIGLPLLDFVTSVVPVSLSNIQWRFATVGLLSNFLMTPMIGMGMLIVVAAVREHLIFQRLLALTTGVMALVLTTILIFFALDIVQLNAMIPPEGLKNFQNAAFKAIVKHVASILVLSFFATAGWRISSWRRSRRRSASVA